jgi:hypothetical protein
MQSFVTSPFVPLAAGWRRNIWLVLLVVGSLAFSLVFACATPFAALAVAASMTLPGGEALLLMLTVWLFNQLTGFLLLDYPQTENSFIWGGVMGVAAVAVTLVSRAVLFRLKLKLPVIVRIFAVFVAAVTAYEGVLLLAALTPLGGLEDFASDIVGRVVSVNFFALIGLVALNRLAAALGLAVPGKSPVY